MFRNNINQLYFLLSKDYRLITDKGICTDSNGKDLHYCKYKYDVSCAAACSGYNWCIGYYYQTTTYLNCWLIPTSLYFRTCPGGYEEWNKNNPAETADDLEAEPGYHPGFSCYSKIPGIIRLILFDHHSYV